MRMIALERADRNGMIDPRRADSKANYWKCKSNHKLNNHLIRLYSPSEANWK